MTDEKNIIVDTRQLEISTTEEVKMGVFSNNVVIQHTPEEFLIDFLFITAHGATLNSRVILTPSHFKRLARAMNENIRKYEDKFGEVAFEIKEKQNK